MNEVMNAQQAGLTPISMLAEEARVYSENMAMNMLNLGRVFTEAKKQVAHGEWGDWVMKYSGMSVRSAQQLMAIYSRFGGKPAFAGLEKSKMYKMLALPEGTEEAFAAENDISAMTSREVDEAVKRVREQANEELRRERAARKAAEDRAEELSNRPPEVPEEVSAALKDKDEQIARQKQEIERVATIGRESVAEANRLRSDNNRLRQELDESAELLDETQQECNRAQTELLNLQSTVAKGDAERVPCDELTADAFAAAVRQFIGVCARMPHMGRTFGAMRAAEHNTYDELLRTIEGWAAEARRALDTYSYGEVEIHG